MTSEVEGFEFIGELGDWDYSWSVIAVWKRGHQLFYDTDGGCSCNGPWESGADPSPITLDELRKELRRRSNWEGRDATEDLIREIEKACES